MSAGGAPEDHHGPAGGVETASGPRQIASAAAAAATDNGDVETTQDDVTQRRKR